MEMWCPDDIGRDSWDWVGPPAWGRACFNSLEWGVGSSPVKTEPPQILFVVVCCCLLLCCCVLLFVVVRCCVVVCCCVLLCVVVCCGVLWCVVVCCGVLWWCGPVCNTKQSVLPRARDAPNYGCRVPVDTAPSPAPVCRALKTHPISSSPRR